MRPNACVLACSRTLGHLRGTRHGLDGQLQVNPAGVWLSTCAGWYGPIRADSCRFARLRCGQSGPLLVVAVRCFSQSLRLRICSCTLASEGTPIEGICVAAGVPSLDKAEEILSKLLAAGCRHIAFKPGTYRVERPLSVLLGTVHHMCARAALTREFLRRLRRRYPTSRCDR